MKTAGADTTGVKIDASNFPDAVFRKYVSDHFDLNGDGYISIPGYKIDANTTESGCVKTANFENLGITDFTGIRTFVNITQLDVANNPITSLDVSANQNGNKKSGNIGLIYLEKIFAQNTSLTAFKYDYWTEANGNTTPLTYVDMRDSKLTELPDTLKNQTHLKKILLSGSDSMTSDLDFYGDPALTFVDIRNISSGAIHLTSSPLLKKLAVNGDVKLTTIWLQNDAKPAYVSYTNNGNVTVQYNSSWASAGLCTGAKVTSGNGFSVCDLS
jgi:Leucine-rich repeat (LRR) protein